MTNLESQISALRDLFETELRVELIAEPLTVFNASTLADEASVELGRRSFDECGVRRGGSVSEIVSRSSLTDRTVGDHATPVPLDRVVASATPIWVCMNRIAEHGSVFVLGKHGLDSIVTAADLNKPPSRMLMFGLISTIEMVLVAAIRRWCPGDSWQQHLTPGRIAKADELFQKRLAVNLQIDLLECLQLCDKTAICFKLPGIASTWGLSKNRAADMFKSLQDIRDHLAHAQTPETVLPWRQVIERLRLGHEILDRCAHLLAGPAPESPLEVVT